MDNPAFVDPRPSEHRLNGKAQILRGSAIPGSTGVVLIPQDVSKGILEADVGKVTFQDPLSDETSKAKRNLLAASFVCILISVLKLEVTGILGLTTGAGSLGNELVQGLACSVVIYMTIGYASRAFVDFSAWKFERERAVTLPYFELLKTLQSNEEKLVQLLSKLSPKVQFKPGPKAPIYDALEQQVSTVQVNIDAVKKRLEDLKAEMAPLLAHWRSSIEAMSMLKLRLRVRFASFWAIDVAVPFLLAGLAIYKSAVNVGIVVARVLA